MSSANRVQVCFSAGVDQTWWFSSLKLTESLCQRLQRPFMARSESIGVPLPLAEGWACFICITVCQVFASSGKFEPSLKRDEGDRPLALAVDGRGARLPGVLADLAALAPDVVAVDHGQPPRGGVAWETPAAVGCGSPSPTSDGGSWRRSRGRPRGWWAPALAGVVEELLASAGGHRDGEVGLAAAARWGSSGSGGSSAGGGGRADLGPAHPLAAADPVLGVDDRNVAARAAADAITAPVAGSEPVGTVAARHRVGARAADEDVAAGAALHAIASFEAVQLVAPVAPRDAVALLAADQLFARRGPVDEGRAGAVRDRRLGRRRLGLLSGGGGALEKDRDRGAEQCDRSATPT